MQANFLFEMDFRNWLLNVIKENGFLIKKQAINAGAEVCGCNPTTAAKYLAKLTSFVGPLMEERDMLGDIIVTFKPEPNRNGKGNGHKAMALGKELRECKQT